MKAHVMMDKLAGPLTHLGVDDGDLPAVEPLAVELAPGVLRVLLIVELDERVALRLPARHRTNQVTGQTQVIVCTPACQCTSAAVYQSRSRPSSSDPRLALWHLQVSP